MRVNNRSFFTLRSIRLHDQSRFAYTCVGETTKIDKY